MNRRTTRSLVLAAAAMCSVGLISACTGSTSKPTAASASSSSSSSSSPAPSSTPAKPRVVVVAAVNYLTGVGAPTTRPVIAVKIDDTANGRPQLNIDKADIVYIEQAEAGLSRLVGVFGTNYPVVGYVRSTRASDPELLLQYGRITLAASGGGGDSLPILDASGLNPWINDRSAGFYARAPHDNDHGYVNLTLNLAEVAASVKTPAAKSVGFTWSASLGGALLSGPGTAITTTVGSTAVDFRWNIALKKYVRYIDGAPQTAADGSPVATGTVIVQTCTVTPHPGDVDVNGNASVFTSSVGHGTVAVFRYGKRINGTWTRPSATAGTTLRDARGHIIPLTPGGAWVALVQTGTAITSS